MCGIVGYISYQKDSSCDINKMLHSIKHRGPDAQDFKDFQIGNAKVVLGHVRLSILDLSHGADQPMIDVSGNYNIVYNGEIYNFKEIRNELESKYAFKTNSDTEVILYAYREWGKECVNKFIGMFSIVILDLLKNQLVFINDRLGVKPLYIYEDDNILIFSSELKGILQYEKVDKNINKKALTQFMQYGYIQSPLSIFEKVRKIEPGTIENHNISSRENKVEKYWSVEQLIQEHSTDINDLDEIIQKACNYRMVSDVPVCSFLSSGIDSSLVTSLLSQNNKLNTITIGVDNVKYNEAELAKNIAKNLDTNHLEKYIQSENLVGLIEKLPYYYDEPFADTSIYPTYMVSQIASEKYKVALSSDGGDEAFGGYYRYVYFKKYYKFISKIPNSIKSFSSVVLRGLYKMGIFNLLNIQMISLKIKKILNSLEAKNISEFYENLNKYISNDRTNAILKKPEYENGYFKEFANIQSIAKNDILNTAMLIDYKTYIYQILIKVDRASMANSLEVREPLLDHNIISFAVNMRSNSKIDDNQTKVPLRKILSKYLDLDLLTKNKKGFAIPIDEWLRKDLKELVENLTSKKAIEKSGVFNYEEVEKIKKSFYSKKDDHIELWHIVTFQLWYNQWVDKIYDRN